MEELLYGVAYYDEYMPYDRLEKDVEMMKKAGINLVRIAESTWSTLEPQDGVFDFYHIDRVLDAMEEAGIHVIVGTPTYAIDQTGPGHLRGQTDHGHHKPPLPVLQRACHKKTDGACEGQKMYHRLSDRQ